MNILQLSEALKGVPKDFLIREATTPSGNYPQYLVVSELSRRTAMEKQFAGINAQQNRPQETVADRTVREATPTPMAAMQGIKSPQTNFQEEPSGQETMGVPGAIRMFEGGRVAFAPGGLGQDGLYGANNPAYSDSLRLKIDEYVNLRATGNKYAIPKLKKLEQDIIALGGKVPPRESITSSIMRNLKAPFSATAREEQGILAASKAREEANKAFGVDPNTMFEYERDAAMERGDYTVDKMPEGDKLGVYSNFMDDQTGREIVPPAGYDPSVTQKAIEEREDTTFDVFRKMRESQEEAKPEDRQGETSYGPSLNIEEQLNEQVTKEPALPDDSDMKSLADEKAVAEIQSYLGPAPEVKNTDDYMKSIENMRKGRPDYLAKVAERTAKLEEGIEKDKKMTVPMSLIQAGLAIATAKPGQGLLGAIAEGGKRGIAEFTSLRKEIRQAEKDFMSAQNEMDLAKAARQEGDMKTAMNLERQAQQDLNNYNSKMADAALKIQERMATDKRFYYGVKAEAVARRDAQQFDRLKMQFEGELRTNLSREQLKAEIFKGQTALAATYDNMIQEAAEGTVGSVLQGATYESEAARTAAINNIRRMKENALKPYRQFFAVNKKEGGMIEAPEKKSRRSIFDFT
jgi:hypothetical protein